MLIMLLLFIILCLSIISEVVFREKFRNFELGGLCIFTWSTFTIVAIFILVLGIYIIVEQTSYTRNQILTEYSERYKVITTTIEREEDLTLLASDIFDYNKEILKARNDINNPWVNWFTNDVYNEIPLIEIEDKEN